MAGRLSPDTSTPGWPASAVAAMRSHAAAATAPGSVLHMGLHDEDDDWDDDWDDNWDDDRRADLHPDTNIDSGVNMGGRSPCTFDF